MSNRLLPLIGILLVSWALIFLGAYVIFELIVPMPRLFPGALGAWLTSSLQVALSAALVFIWLLIMVKLRDLYVRRSLLR